jgi:hypothetical protein
VGVTLPSIRIPVVCLLAMLAVLMVAAPGADAKGKSRGTVCAASAGALRPSPLRACVRTRKAPRALPSANRAETAARSRRRRAAAESRVVAMMGRAGA